MMNTINGSLILTSIIINCFFLLPFFLDAARVLQLDPLSEAGSE